MKVELVGISPRDSFGMVLVKFSVSSKRDKTWDGGIVEVFVPASDSISEIRRTALENVRKLAQEMLEYPANESAADDPDNPSAADFPEVTFDIQAGELKD